MVSRRRVLTQDDIDDIIKSYNKPTGNMNKLAEQYGVSFSTIKKAIEEAGAVKVHIHHECDTCRKATSNKCLFMLALTEEGSEKALKVIGATYNTISQPSNRQKCYKITKCPEHVKGPLLI